jgi:hypothetical protein
MAVDIMEREDKQMARIIHIDGSTELMPVVSLDHLQTAVGGYIEEIKIQGTKNSWLIVNEEGKLRNLPINKTASAIVGLEIVGDVVVCEASELNAKVKESKEYAL